MRFQLLTSMEALTLFGIKIAQLKRYADKKMDGDTNPRGAQVYLYFKLYSNTYSINVIIGLFIQSSY